MERERIIICRFFLCGCQTVTFKVNCKPTLQLLDVDRVLGCGDVWMSEVLGPVGMFPECK